MSQYTIASVSCGKDSLVIPHEYIRRGLRLDEVIMYDTGMEFQAIYDEWAALVKLLDKNGIKYTVLKPAYDFCWQMFERPVNQGKENEHLGYSWCGGPCCTFDENLECPYKKDDGSCWMPPPEIVPTNADRIRAMSDEELAELLTLELIGAAPCKLFVSLPTGGQYMSRKFTKEKTLEWLKQPAEGG